MVEFSTNQGDAGEYNPVDFRRFAIPYEAGKKFTPLVNKSSELNF